MKRLNFYTLKSFIGPFILTFFICIFILLMQFLWKYLDDMVGKGLENSVIIELMSYASLGLVPMALPLAVLLASIMAFGNLGERFELLAIKASGISLLKIMRPLIYFNIIITFVAFFLANEVIPVANTKFAALLWSIKKQRPEMIIKEGVFSNEIDGYSIKVSKRDKETNALLGIMIYDHTENKGNTNVIVADSGYLNMSDDKEYMILNLYNGESYADTKPATKNKKDTYPFRREKFKHEQIVVSVKNYNLKRADDKHFENNYRMLRNRQIEEATAKLKTDYDKNVHKAAISINYNNQLNNDVLNSFEDDSSKIENQTSTVYHFDNIDTIYNSLTKITKKAVLLSAQKRAQQNQRVVLQYESTLGNKMIWMNKHWIEWHKKYTLSIACLIFFFIGAPLGAIIRKGGFGMPVVVSILLFISYYLVSVITEKVAREGVWDINTLLWIPTVVYIVIGIILTHQAVTDSLILQSESYKKISKKIGQPIAKVIAIFASKRNRE